MTITWHNGDECEITGEVEFHAGISWDVLRRLSDNKRILRLPVAEMNKRTAQRQKEWLEQQAEFCRLREP